MMPADYRLGDVPTACGPMRLTVGGLAEMTVLCDAPDLHSLASHIRAMSPSTARHVATVLLRPCGGAGLIDGASDAQVAALMPAAASCITTALTVPS